ncbi:MAG: CYTH domain-containing protein [Firmicutes bacterium]|nr:CYTH domain-containing protein [Bacillota bacterium]
MGNEKEIELKFLIEEDIVKERIFDDSHLREMAEPEAVETIQMEAIYYDTIYRGLQAKEVAFRIRREDQRMVATLKWGGSSEEGLHVRGELNVPVDQEFCQAPTIEIFKGSAIYHEIQASVADQPLIPVMEMDFIRKQIQVDTGKSISVISYDEGEIRTESGRAPISELEVELYSGSQEDMVELGRELAAKYNLKEENKSKYQLGLELME